MKRLLTFATTGLLATGLAVLPVTVFAQPSATMGTDAKPTTSTHSATNDARVAPGNKDSGATKDSATSTATKLSTTPKLSTAPTGGAAKTTGNHDKGA
jgi:hypothetical protein